MDATVTALGVRRRAVLTHSPTFARRAVARVLPDPVQGPGQAARAGVKLARALTRRARTAVEAEIADILKTRWVAEVITVTLTGEQPADRRLTWRTSTRDRKTSGTQNCPARGSCSPTVTPGLPSR